MKLKFHPPCPAVSCQNLSTAHARPFDSRPSSTPKGLFLFFPGSWGVGCFYVVSLPTFVGSRPQWRVSSTVLGFCSTVWLRSPRDATGAGQERSKCVPEPSGRPGNSFRPLEVGGKDSCSEGMSVPGKMVPEDSRLLRPLVPRCSPAPCPTLPVPTGASPRVSNNRPPFWKLNYILTLVYRPRPPSGPGPGSITPC